MNRLIIGLSVFVYLVMTVDARTWRHKSDPKKVVVGDFVRFIGNDVEIKVTAGKRAGKIIPISRFDLSKADRDWLAAKEKEIEAEKKVPKHKAKGVEDLEEQTREEGVKEEVKEKGSNMVTNIGLCVLVLAELMFIMAGMSSGVLRGIIAAIPGIGWVLFALMEWQNAKTPFIIGIVGICITAGGYVMGGGKLL